MKAVIEHEDGSLKTVGELWDFEDFVWLYVQDHIDVTRIWRVMDGEEWDADAKPFWEAEILYLRIENLAGEVAKVALPVQEEGGLWDAIDRAFPEAWDVLEPGDVDVIGDSGLRLDRWDLSFRPGEGKALADWFCRIPRRLWGAVFEEAALGVWDEGWDAAHLVQPAKWKGRRIGITYCIPDAESFNADVAARGDDAYPDYVESMELMWDERARFGNGRFRLQTHRNRGRGQAHTRPSGRSREAASRRPPERGQRSRLAVHRRHQGGGAMDDAVRLRDIAAELDIIRGRIGGAKAGRIADALDDLWDAIDGIGEPMRKW